MITITIAIVSCLKSFHKSESKSILSATASICNISLSMMVYYHFSVKIKHESDDSSDNEFIVLSFSLCMTTVYIVSLNANVTKI